MAYEYKSIIVADYNEILGKENTVELNEYFDEGWEYVDGIAQSVTTGTSYSKKGTVMIILKKLKNILPE